MGAVLAPLCVRVVPSKWSMTNMAFCTLLLTLRSVSTVIFVIVFVKLAMKLTS